MFAVFATSFRSLPKSIDDVFARFAKPIRSRRSAPEIRADLATLNRTFEAVNNRLSNAISRLLKVEADLQRSLEKQEAQLLMRFAAPRRRLEIELLNALYPALSLKFLAATQLSSDEYSYVPRFAVFSVDHYIAQIESDGTAPHYIEWERRFTGIPRQLIGHFDLRSLGKRAMNRHSRRGVYARFRGIVPDEARRLIESARPDFEQLFLIAVAPRWNTAKSDHNCDQMPPGNVLIAGLKHDRFWVLDKFTPVTVQELIENALAAV